MKNKEKILHSATRLFNENGFVNVRLQHISDDAIISVGNIAYHFKNKEAIVKAIFLEWQEKLKEVLIEYRHTPIFANVDRIFSEAESMQETYSFFFTDLIEIRRAYPDVFEQIQQFLEWQLLLFIEIVRFNVSRGALKKMSQEEIDFLAALVVEQINTWSARKLTWQHKNTRGQASSISTFCWKTISPYMTKVGREELEIYVRKKINLDTDKNHL